MIDFTSLDPNTINADERDLLDEGPVVAGEIRASIFWNLTSVYEQVQEGEKEDHHLARTSTSHPYMNKNCWD